MGKIKIDGKEIEFDMSSMKRLSDDELETISGGLSIDSLNFYTWFCNTCHEEGAVSLGFDATFKETMKTHKSATGHCQFTVISMVYRDGLGFFGNAVWTETV
jgi:bacteriocin-like protein